MIITKSGIVIDKDYLDGHYLCSFGKRTIIDRDIEDNTYRKEIRFMTDKSIIDDSLILKLHSERRYVVLLVNYITNHLVWGHNYISLIPKDIIASTGIDKSDISKAIKRLVELEIIKQASSVKEEYKDIDKHIYIINHNYIFKGNIKNLIKDIKNND